MKDIEELFTIIPPYPGQNICFIDNLQMDIIKKLKEFCIKNEINLFIKDMQSSLSVLGKVPFVKVEKFSFDDKRYNPHSILYDFVFLSYELGYSQDILKKFYRVIKNAGNIFIFTKSDQSDMIKLLEDINFVAVNQIDTFKDFHIISAKKMHGWMKV